MSARVGGAVAAAGRVAPTHGDRLVSAPALHAGHDGTRGESALSNTVRRVEFEAFLGGRGAKRGAAASTGARKTLAPRGGAFSGAARRPVTVFKFGSSVLAHPGRFARVAEEVKSEVECGRKVVAVVSAMAGLTDSLIAAGETVAPVVPDDFAGPLLATGEEASVALLALALATSGVRVRGLTVRQLGIRTRGALGDADPVSVDTGRLASLLQVCEAIVVPGFLGVDATGATSLLGRGGSDLTALFLGHALRASEVCLVKDVDGIFPRDPKRFGATERLRQVSWDRLRRIGGGVVQEKAIAFAARHGVRFRVAALGSAGTVVGERPPTPGGVFSGASRGAGVPQELAAGG